MSPTFRAFLPAFPTGTAQGQITPIFDYARSPRWRFPFARTTSHLPARQRPGLWRWRAQRPGPDAGGGCGNLLCSPRAGPGHRRPDYAGNTGTPSRSGPTTCGQGLDPEHQLCTDDFAGHSRTTPTSASRPSSPWAATLDGEAWRGKGGGEVPPDRRADGHGMDAPADDGDHYRLVYDRPGSWSQKYNLVWTVARSRSLPRRRGEEGGGLVSRPPEPLRPALGQPLGLHKLDWTVWSATLAEDDADFRALVEPLWDWANETPTRVP